MGRRRLKLERFRFSSNRGNATAFVSTQFRTENRSALFPEIASQMHNKIQLGLARSNLLLNTSW